MTTVRELAGTVLGDGRYAVREALGTGAFGTVYKSDELLDGFTVRQVALKIYTPEASRVKALLADCVLPARVLASSASPQVKRHFVQIHHFGYLDTPAGRCAFVAMELLRGATTMAELVAINRHYRRFPAAELVEDYLWQCCVALDAAHTAGVVHRDIKGDNVMIDADGVLRLLDFGVGALLSQADAPIQTALSVYAPENFDGRHTAASDVYQMGLLFYEFYTGIAPYAGTGPDPTLPGEIVRARAKRFQFHYLPGKWVPGCHSSDALDEVLAGCLEYSELLRYGSARVVLEALDKAKHTPRTQS